MRYWLVYHTTEHRPNSAPDDGHKRRPKHVEHNCSC